MAWFDFLNPLNAITGALTKAYEAKLAAANDSDRIAAEVEIKNLEARRDVVIAAAVNDKWWSPRTIMGWSAAIYVAKLVVWDTVLQLGVTPDPGEQVTLIVMTIVGFYFVAKGAETVANTIAGVVRRK
jgi:hypothetical protein